MVKHIGLYLAVLLYILVSGSFVMSQDTDLATAPEQIWHASQERFTVRHQGMTEAIASAPQPHGVILTGRDEGGQLPKSRGRAFLQSLLLPGWGQHYAESRTMMKVFIASEALVLGSFFGLQTWSGWLEDDYRTLSVTHAGVQLRGKADAYFVDIGRFADIFAYNQAQLRDRDVADLYPETSEFFWRWDSNKNRNRYDDLRKRSALAKNRSEFALAAIFVNHLASAIHSTLAAFKYNKRLKKEALGFRFEFEDTTDDTRLAIVLTRPF